ncbi:hypothetical protein QUF75_00100 [Desulfococcaceae bacterium HSG7]|nr:hypothetical protein [Desulfococcaceae bacterium HSG7]
MMFALTNQINKLKLLHNSGYIIFSVSFVVTVMSYFYLFTNIDVEIELQGTPESALQFFWRGKNDPYRESWSRHVNVKQEPQKIDFMIRDYKFIRVINPIIKLRIDPAREPDVTIIIKRMVVRQLGFKTIIIETSADFKKLIPLADIKLMRHGADGLEFVTSGEDSQIELTVKSEIDYKFLVPVLFFSLVIGYVLGILFGCFNNNGRFTYIPYFMIIVLALTLTASIICSNLHLDEIVHVEAAMYYEDHWLPPEICDPDTIDSYSVYGNSRLNTFEIVYLLAGKFSRLLRFTELEQAIRLRLFNILLFLVILAACILKWDYRILALPLIISPQIWYTFSYFNSEAFSLFVLFFISWQSINQDSSLNQFIKNDNGPPKVIHAILLGLAFALTLQIKKTFYIFLIFLALYFFIKLINKEFPSPLSALKRIFLILLIAVSIFGLRYSLDVYINGFDRKTKIAECKEKMAEPIYKMSTELHKTHTYLSLRDRGITLKQLFSSRNWGLLTFASTFGIYNYAPAASKHYYKIVFLLVMWLSILVCISAFSPFNRSNVLMLLSFILCSAFLIGSSIRHSWLNDFQAQGRYLFPIFTMSGVLIYELLRSLNKRFHNFLIITMFLLGIYSYIFIFLINMPKFS